MACDSRCKDACTANAACHAFDLDYPFVGTCWLFSNTEGSHLGDGTATSRCYVKVDTTPTIELLGNAITTRNHPDVRAQEVCCCL